MLPEVPPYTNRTALGFELVAGWASTLTVMTSPFPSQLLPDPAVYIGGTKNQGQEMPSMPFSQRQERGLAC